MPDTNLAYEQDIKSSEWGVENIATPTTTNWIDVTGFNTLTIYISGDTAGAVTFTVDISQDDLVSFAPLPVASSGGGGLVNNDPYSSSSTISAPGLATAVRLEVENLKKIRINNLVAPGLITVSARASTR